MEEFFITTNLFWKIGYQKSIVLLIFYQIFCFFSHDRIYLTDDFIFFVKMQKQRINHNLFTKKLVLTGVLFFLFFWVLGTSTYADALNDTISDLTYYFNLVYFLIRPFIMLWWLLVDNTLAYGEAFGLDGILWNLWNICKNISNFAIGAVFLFSIFRYILQQKGELKNVIKNCLIAGVLVQISWFLVATLIDVSTIATYGIWGLPLTLSKDASSTSSQKEKFTTLWEHLVIDSNDLDHTFNVFLTTKGWNAISPCNTVETKVDFTWFTDDQLKIFPLCLWKQASSCSTWSEYATTLIIWPKFFKTKDWWEEMTILTGFCHYNGNVFRYNDALLFSWVSDINQQINHRDQLSQTATFSWTDERFLWWALLSTNLVSFEYPTSDNPQLQYRYGYIKRNDLDELFGLIGSSERLFNVDELIEESKSYLGVFASLYSSLTNVIRFDKISSKYSSTFEQLTNVSIDLLYTLALFVPIITMVIVLGFRLVMVWAIIVLTPFIIVLRCFKDDLVGILWEDVKKQFTWDGTGWYQM